MGDQSPINISRENCKQFNPPPLIYSSYFLRRQVVAQNDGEKVRLLLNEQETPACLSGGELRGTYDLKEIQFRWGPNNSSGTEHALNGRKFSLEAQLIHYKSEYQGFPDMVITQPDGIVVVSFFFQVACHPDFGGCNQDNPRFAILAEALRTIQNPLSSVQLDIEGIMSLFEEKATPEGYFTYFGSLTTPNYESVVTWILYPTLIIISDPQMQCFRNLISANGNIILANARPLQPINGRIILYC
ncbi:hypothetical protein L9F63_022458 [Diploptera punctata]|uniref:Alpha-carbonic anhydrase domain-containing protein n=1 Tax=Diploptera punctata TaxID=6984 RepID=A0AAD7ZNA8_DIPPU|nr:hypothetical protein L9F63_022458 [Diploptera punctata]